MQDEDGYDPDLDEMETTTERNRGSSRGRRPPMRRNAPPGPVAPVAKRSRGSKFGPQHGDQPDAGDNPFEGTAPLKKSNNPAPGKGAVGGGEAKGGGHHGIAIIIQPMSNPVEERRQSIRNDINKAIKTEKRRGPR